MNAGRSTSEERHALSVVVPTYQRESDCHACLRSLADVSERTGIVIELIVVEQGPEPGYEIPADFNGLWLFSEVNGASYARNLGLEHATHDSVMFFDDDGLAFDGIADVVAERDATGAAVVCGRMLTPDGQAGRGGARRASINERTAFRFFIEGSAVWDRARLLETGAFDERLGPPLAYGAEEGAEALSRVLSSEHTGSYLPVDVLGHPAVDRSPPGKAFRYGRGTAGAAWLSPGAWTVGYAVVSGVRRIGGVVRSLVRRDVVGAKHRVGWLAGLLTGAATGWRLRRLPSHNEHRPVLVRHGTPLRRTM